MPYLTLVNGLAAALLTSSLAGSVSAQPPDQLIVEVVTVNGSGCPGSTATAEVLPDNSSFRITFSGYFAWTGAGAAPTDFRKNCQFNLRIQAPDGLTYAVEQAEYSGFALLGDGVTGLQAASYYFQGQAPTTSARHEFTGPVTDRWRTTDLFGPEELRFAPCDEERNLNVNTELRVRPGADDLNVMVLDPTAEFRLTFRECG